MCKRKLRKRASSFLAKLNDYYLRLIENSSDVFYLINAKEGTFEYISPAITKISGFTPEETIEMGMEGVRKRLHPDKLRTIKESIIDVLAKKVLPKNFDEYTEQKFKHKAGHWIWIGIKRHFITDRKGKIEAVVGNIRDITEIKLLQQKLETSLNNYKALYNNARVPLYRTRINDGTLIECNEALAKVLGYKTKEECLVKHRAENYYTDSKRRVELIQLLKEKGQIDNFEIKARRATGENVWMKVSAALNPEEGFLEGAIWDVTTYKLLTKAENEVLDLVMQGKSNKQIASELERSIRTVEEHRAKIMQKVGAHNIVELTKKTLSYGI